MRRILIIDDDRELCALLQEYLDAEGFVCHFAHNGVEGLDRALPAEADLVILDVMLPGKNGFEVLAAMRADPTRSGLPIIMLTARGDDVNRVVGLEMGADDYLSKPFNPRELLARIRAVLRRTGPASSDAAVASCGPDTPGLPARHAGDNGRFLVNPRCGASVAVLMSGESVFAEKARTFTAPVPSEPSIVLDEGALRARVDGKSVELTGQECRLLRLLLETPGELVSRDRLSREGLGHPVRPFDRSLDMQVSRIRKKLGPARDGSERIRSVRGEGYMLLTGGLSC